MIYDNLYDWQKRIVQKFKDKQAYGLFLDMGLGKTPLSLAFAEYNNCQKVLVVTINAKATENETTFGSWLNWSNKSKINWTHHTKFDKCFDSSNVENELMLINYESLFERGSKKTSRMTLKANVINFIESCKNKNVAIIIDESHKLKNLQSQQTLAIQKIQKMLILRAKNCYTYLLTGTPFTVGYIDLYCQLKLLGMSMTKTQFVDMFCIKGNIPGLLGWQQPIVGYKNLDDLYKLIHKFAITIKSEEIVDLPNKVFVNHVCPLSNQFTLFTTEFVSGTKILEENNNRTTKLQDTSKYETSTKCNNPYFRNIAYPDFKWIAYTNGTFWLRARQLAIGFQGNNEDSIWYDTTRLQLIKQFLSTNEDNYVLFYNFTPELLELFEICQELNYNIDVYCGEVKSLFFYETYASQTEEQRLTNKKNIILANFASGSTGMNWQLYNKCIISSIPLYKDWEQGLKRIHRLGQKSTVIYHIFYQHCWLDESMKRSLETNTQYTLDMFNSDIQRIQVIKND